MKGQGTRLGPRRTRVLVALMAARDLDDAPRAAAVAALLWQTGDDLIATVDHDELCRLLGGVRLTRVKERLAVLRRCGKCVYCSGPARVKRPECGWLTPFRGPTPGRRAQWAWQVPGRSPALPDRVRSPVEADYERPAEPDYEGTPRGPVEPDYEKGGEPGSNGRRSPAEPDYDLYLRTLPDHRENQAPNGAARRPLNGRGARAGRETVADL